MTTNDHMERALRVREVRGAPSRARLFLANPSAADREFPLPPFSSRLGAGSLPDACLPAVALRRTPQRDGQTVGAALRSLVRNGAISESTATTRMLALTRQEWPAAMTSIRSVVALCDTNGIGLDWHDLAWAAAGWERDRHSAAMRRWALAFANPPRTDAATTTDAFPQSIDAAQPAQ